MRSHLRLAPWIESTVLLAAAATAQDLTAFGTGCGGPNTLSAWGSPTPGRVVELRLDGAAPRQPHVLLAGLGNQRWSGGSLPFTLPTSWGFAAGCSLLVADDLLVSLPVDASGTATVPIGVDCGMVGFQVYFQVLGFPAGGPFYATGGIAATLAAGPPTTIAGRVRERATGVAVAAARITAFTPGLSAFAEARTDAGGGYTLPVPPGHYRLGVAARGRDYVEADVDVPPAGGTRDFSLDPESHTGRWDVVGNTLPHTLDATDIGFLLPDGRIFYCHDTLDPILFDPTTGTKTLPASSGLEQGCTHGTLLEDGRLVQVGGQASGNFRDATRQTKTWSPTRGWERLADLLHPTGRWYPGLARLADGTLLVMGGGTLPNAARTDTCELFDQATETWRPTGPMGQAVEYPPAALLYTGDVLRTWGRPQLYDPTAGTWRDTGAFNAANRGWPGHSDHSLVVLADGSALAVGINTMSAGAAAAMVERYDPSQGTWTPRSSPSLKRMQAEVIALPDGSVLVAAGDKQNLPSGEPEVFGIVRRCDLYEPETDRWRRVADMRHFREYHAVTLLVPDGRVLTTGGTQIKFRVGPTSADIEAWSPPYLFRGVRPRMDNFARVPLRRGATIAFDVFPATRITEVVLQGTGVHTHWVEGGVPRRLRLGVQQAGSRVTATLPTDVDVLPVGHYLMFAMVDDIPSVRAEIVRVTP